MVSRPAPPVTTERLSQEEKALCPTEVIDVGIVMEYRLSLL